MREPGWHIKDALVRASSWFTHSFSCTYAYAYAYTLDAYACIMCEPEEVSDSHEAGGFGIVLFLA